VHIYVDGKPQPLTILRDELAGTIQSDVGIHLGSRDETYRFRGLLDDVRIYNRRLGEKEVGRLYESGIQAVIRIATENRTPEQKLLLADNYRPLDEPSQRLTGQLVAAQKSLREMKLDSIRRWYVNSRGQTMVVIPGPVEFLMGSPLTEAGRSDDETQHKKRIGRTFALAAKSVTVEQYRQFDKDYELPAMYTRTADLPVMGTSWHQAAAYCNWLSKEEGLNKEQWCYEIKDGQVTKLKANYLSLTGYRLPTEAEMEFAARSGALTSRYFGETEDLLPKYAWYTKNSQDKTWPVGSLKPNDLGLFDVQGNVYTWCQERYKDYPQGKGEEPEDDKEDILIINNQNGRVMRGGSFFYLTSNVRCAHRVGYVPSFRNYNIGFRPARTFTP
jgi:formylglycine-generating enzyme required for sulfatase activity